MTTDSGGNGRGGAWRTFVRALVVPSAVSVTIHALLVALLASVTWTIAGSSGDSGGGAVVLDLPARGAENEPAQEPEPSTAGPSRSGPAAAAPAPPADSGSAGDAPEPSPVPPPPEPGRLAAGQGQGASALSGLARDRPSAIAFAGVRARRASSVVFVVDASGAMASSLPLVIEELKRTISRLDREVRFQVVVFRDRSKMEPGSAGTAVLPPTPHGPGLRAATPAHKAAASEWLDQVFPSGRSNPLAGLERALGFERRPELVMLLARSIERTEEGSWGAGKARILNRLNELNPVRGGGGRATTIRTIQFIDDDPTGIMQEIARTHGRGLEAYTRRTVEDLVEAGEKPDPALELGRRIDEAIARLDELARDATDLFVLYGLADDRARARTRDAGAAVARILQGAGGATVGDALGEVLLARARILRAAASADGGALSTIPAPEPDASIGDPVAWQGHVQRILGTMVRGGGPGPDAELDRLLARALERAPEGVEAPARFEALVARVRVAPDASSREGAAGRARALLEAPPLGEPDRVDPLLALVLADARALGARAAASDGDASSHRAVFTPYLELLADAALDMDESARRGMAFDRLARLAEPDMPLEALPPEVAYAEAMALRDAGAHPERALELLAGVAERAEAGRLARDAMIVLARERAEGDPAGAAELYFRIADRWPSVPGAARAMQRALSLALDRLEAARGSDGAPEASSETGSESESARALDRYARYLDAALRDPSLDSRDYWADQRDRVHLMRARAAPLDAALDLIERIEPGSARAGDALTLLDTRLDSAAPPSTAQLERSAAIFEAHGAGARAARARLELAERLVEADPERGARLAASLAEDGPGVARIDAMLVRARALRAAERHRAAFEALRPLLEDHPRPGGSVSGDRFWSLWTLALESMAALEGSDRAAVRAQLARLRTIDRDLGGEAYRARLERVRERIGR